MATKRKIKILIVFLVFIFAIILRLWNINQMGRTWDEQFYTETGQKFVNLAINLDFDNPKWYKEDSSNGPPLALYFFGLTSFLDKNNYDYTYSRMTSVIFSSLTVVLVFLFGWKYISFPVGFISSVMLGMLPLMIGYSQLATLESYIVFFFTATIFSFFNLLSKFSKKNLFLTGILLGLSLTVKYTNVLLIPLMFSLLAVFYLKSDKKKKDMKMYLRGMLVILVTAFVAALIVWPMPWIHLGEVLKHNSTLRSYPYSVPEVFFGKLVLVPKVYYLVYFLITTPLLILTFFLAGLKIIFFKRTWIFIAILIWFIFPFIQSFYNFKQHGIRYIIEIYVPLALISGIGFNYIVSRLRNIKYVGFVLAIVLLSYSFLTISRITPYYLDYFNEIVGGTKNVYEKKLFQMGWWGQGIREAALYVQKNASKGSRVGIALSPSIVMPKLEEMIVQPYKEDASYDYVIVNYYNIIREGFDDSKIRKKYNSVYVVWADGASLATVYRQK
ncbi:MAG: phospholipid carrier-dependent glycosyltransferase [Candidatus Levybacteria bacterium]|nr:phospholipid carrier-dependent glycosyltransferase [Candidatus Levybacteria bacterium]